MKLIPLFGNTLMVLGAVGILASTAHYVATKQPVSHVPAFKAGDCFVRNGIRETWEPAADGKVAMKGQLKYLLMDSSEAERKSGGTKFGYYESIDIFDGLHRKVLCPENWKPRGITK